MRRWLAVLFVVLVPLVLAQETTGVTMEARVFDIARQLRCPICVSESVAASSAQISLTMRAEIQEYILAGLSDQEILDEFTASYGDWILLEPPRRGIHLLVWLLPVVVAIAGAAMLIGFMRRSTRAAAEPVEVSEEELTRLREVLGQEDDGDNT